MPIEKIIILTIPMIIYASILMAWAQPKLSELNAIGIIVFVVTNMVINISIILMRTWIGPIPF